MWSHLIAGTVSHGLPALMDQDDIEFFEKFIG